VFEKGVLRRTFRQKREVRENCVMRSLITRVLRQVLIRITKSRRVWWAGHEARMGRIGMLVGKPEGKGPV
jgi:hypothetical protein